MTKHLLPRFREPVSPERDPRDAEIYQLKEQLRVERGRRASAVAEVKKLKEITKDKRDLLAMCEQLQDECNVLQSQAGTWWENTAKENLRQKHRIAERYDPAVRGLILAWRWLLHFDTQGPEPDAPILDVWACIEQAIPGKSLDGIYAHGWGATPTRPTPATAALPPPKSCPSDPPLHT